MSLLSSSLRFPPIFKPHPPQLPQPVALLLPVLWLKHRTFHTQWEQVPTHREAFASLPCRSLPAPWPCPPPPQALVRPPPRAELLLPSSGPVLDPVTPCENQSSGSQRDFLIIVTSLKLTGFKNFGLHGVSRSRAMRAAPGGTSEHPHPWPHCLCTASQESTNTQRQAHASV